MQDTFKFAFLQALSLRSVPHSGSPLSLGGFATWANYGPFGHGGWRCGERCGCDALGDPDLDFHIR